jgi:Fe-S cluster assembly iron-binding protein IscA
MVMSRDSSGNLTISAESTFTTVGAPAFLAASGWNANVTNDGGLQVIVSFLANNTGDLTGSYELKLTANDVEVETKQVDLSPGASNNITFDAVNDISGKYTVTVDGSTVLFSMEVPAPATGFAWWLLVVTAVGAAIVTAVLVILIRRRALVPVSTKGEFQFPSLTPKYTTTTNELEEARLEAEEAKRAWREAQEARIEAEEAKEAVTKAASEAINEAKEIKDKSKRELEESKKLAQEAATAKRLYGEARTEAEEAKRAWGNARKAKRAGRADERAKIEAQESEERAARLIRKVEVGSTEAGEDKIEVNGVTATARALQKLKESISSQSQDATAVVRIVNSPTDPNQFEMKMGNFKAGDRVLERDGQKILAFSAELEPMLTGITIDIRETPDGVHFTMSRRTPT